MIFWPQKYKINDGNADARTKRIDIVIKITVFGLLMFIVAANVYVAIFSHGWNPPS